MVASKFFVSSAIFAIASAAITPKDGMLKNNVETKKYGPRDTSDVDIVGQVLAGISDDVSKAQQAVTSLQMQFITKAIDSASSEDVKTLISGIDSEAENVMNSVRVILDDSPASSAISNSVLASFYQQVVGAVGVSYDTMNNVKIDSELSSSLKEMGKTLDNMAEHAQKLQLSTNLISEINNAKDTVCSHTSLAQKIRRQINVLDNVISGVTVAKQNIDALTNTLITKGGENPALDQLHTVISGLDSQIDSTIGSVSKNVAPNTTPMTSENAEALFGPFMTSVSKSSEVLLTYMSKKPLDPVLAPSVKNLESTIGNLANFADRYNLKTQQTNLININHRIHLLFVDNSPANVAAPMTTGINARVFL